MWEYFISCLLQFFPQNPPRTAWGKQKAAEARWETGGDASWIHRRNMKRRDEQVEKAAEKAREALLRRNMPGTQQANSGQGW